MPKPSIVVSISACHRSTPSNESWTAQTRVYQTQLACAPSEIKASEGTEYTFSTDKCTYSIDPLPNSNATQNMMYIGLANYNGDSDHNLNNSKTERKGLNLLLAI